MYVFALHFRERIDKRVTVCSSVMAHSLRESQFELRTICDMQRDYNNGKEHMHQKR